MRCTVSKTSNYYYYCYICCQIYVGYLNYIPETNHVCTVYSVAACLSLQFMLYVMLFPMINVLYLYSSTIMLLLPLLGMQFSCCLLPLQIFKIVCICCLFLFTVFLWHDVLFVVPDRMLLSFHFQFLSDIPSKAMMMMMMMIIIIIIIM